MSTAAKSAVAPAKLGGEAATLAAAAAIRPCAVATLVPPNTPLQAFTLALAVASWVA